jgi:hypothetical protein
METLYRWLDAHGDLAAALHRCHQFDVDGHFDEAVGDSNTRGACDRLFVS